MTHVSDPLHMHDMARGLAQTLTAGLTSWLHSGIPFNARRYVRPNGDDWCLSAHTFIARDMITATHGFCMPGPSFAARVGRFGPVVEIGAGRGFLSALLRASGVDSIATDAHVGNNRYGWTPHQDWPVVPMAAATAVLTHPNRTVLCSWPCYDQDWARQALSTLQPDQVVCLIGEGAGGCTGNDALFAMLARDFEELTEDADDQAVIPWQGIHDTLTVWRHC